MHYNHDNISFYGMSCNNKKVCKKIEILPGNNNNQAKELKILPEM
jgi:hypothetical protein